MLRKTTARGIGARAAASLLATLAIALAATQAASAHDTYPSWHRAAHYGCGYYTTTGQWSLMSAPEMWRADGYTNAVLGTGGSAVDPMTGAISGNSGSIVDGHTQQWLYYRVVVGTPRSDGSFLWSYGNWIARKEQLGAGTDGLSTWVQQSNGTWVESAYSQVGYSDGTQWIGPGLDVSIVTRKAAQVPLGRKYVYGHMIWGPIYNYKTRQPVFPQYEHWEPLGWVSCA